MGRSRDIHALGTGMADDSLLENEQVNLPEALVERVKEALEHLFDLSYLQRHALAQGDEFTEGGEIAAEYLRRELVAAIESLSPGAGLPFRVPQARFYNLLTLRYVEGITVQEAAHKLGISRRQAHRDMRRAIESVAAILSARRSKTAPTETKVARFHSAQEEMARLGECSHLADMKAMLQRTLGIVGQLASQRDIEFRTELPDRSATLSTDPMVAEQVLVDTLSRTLEQADAGGLSVRLVDEEGQMTLFLRYLAAPEAANVPVVGLVATQLMERLGWTARQQDQQDGHRTVALRMKARGPTVLVIDDNEGLVNLLKRYLADQPCGVIAAADGQEGLRMAQELLPDVIALDVMMPGMHGWEVLQRLRNQPRTENLPVIVVSVFNNPELAYSLGASLFLPKPVSRQQVLDALHQVGVL